MNIKKYDGKCVQITDKYNNKVYEGLCQYNSHDYTFHEYGKDEDSLEIFHFLFYKSDIKKIKIIDRFTEKYGEIEKETAMDMDMLEQALDDEDDIHVYRLLLCLEDIGINKEVKKLLNNLIKYNKDEKIINKAKELIKEE